VELLPPELFVSDEPFKLHDGDFGMLTDEIVRKNVDTRPMYFDYSSSHALVLPYELMPHGIVYKVTLPGDSVDGDVWDRYNLRGLMAFSLTARDLDRLSQEAQITDSIVPKLAPLQDRVFSSEREFLRAAAQHLGQDLTLKYQEFLLVHAVFRPQIALDPDINRTFLLYGSARIELGNYYLQFDELEKAAVQFNAAVRFDPSLGSGIAQMLQFRDKMVGSNMEK
jgi:hypothetical protein